MRASSLSFMIQVLIEQVNTIAVLTLNSPLKVIITSFVNSREACGLQALIFDVVYGWQFDTFSSIIYSWQYQYTVKIL